MKIRGLCFSLVWLSLLMVVPAYAMPSRGLPAPEAEIVHSDIKPVALLLKNKNVRKVVVKAGKIAAVGVTRGAGAVGRAIARHKSQNKSATVKSAAISTGGLKVAALSIREKKSVIETINRIKSGVRHPHRNDGIFFENREARLPIKESGYELLP